MHNTTQIICVRAMPRQVIPFFLGINHCHPFQDKYSHDLSNSRTWPSMTNLPKRSISILSRLGYSLRWHPFHFSPTPRQASPPTLKCQSKGVPDCDSHDPTDTSNQRKPFICSLIYPFWSHQSSFVLNQPRAQLGEVPRDSSLVHGILKSSPRVLHQDTFP